MSNKLERFPETAVFTNDCFSPNYLFRDRAIRAFEVIEDSINSFSNLNQAYFNNVIGILGGRGAGKTSLLKSILETIEAKEYLVPGNDGKTYYIRPLADLIDPKVLPDNISIVNYVLSVLYIDFKNQVNNKKISDEIANYYFQKFDDLNESISLLSRVIRQDPIDNPSDLYDIGNIIKIRKDLEDLVQELLDLYTKKYSRKAFIVPIDDFDLDSSNIHKMVLDLTSFLTVKGLVFLTSFDPVVFSDEIVRQRIKTISDYGVNQFIRADSRFVTAQNAFFKPDEIIEKAEKYEEQIYNKFIPHDYRIQVTQSVRYMDDRLRNVLSNLCDFLFGFSANKMPAIPFSGHRNAVFSLIREYIVRFYEAIALTSDLRTRNQLLNQIIDLLEYRKSDGRFQVTTELKRNLEGMSRIVDSQDNKSLLRAVANQLSLPSSNDTNENYLKNQIVYENGDIIVSARDLAPDFWANHPCASLLYNEIINRIDFEGADYAYRFIALFELFRNEVIPITAINGEEIAKINGREYNIELFSHPSMNLNGRAIAKSIQLYVSNTGSIAKYQFGKYVSLLEEYNSSLDEEDKVLARYIDAMKNMLQMQWKGEQLREMRLEARKYLAFCARRLQR